METELEAKVIDLPDALRPLFVEAGWYPGRRVDVCFGGLEGLRTFSKAAEILRTLGGLSVGRSGPGKDFATSDIEFFIDPSIERRKVVAGLEKPGDDLFPIGLAQCRHMELFLDSKGRLIAYAVPSGELDLLGETFEAGVDSLLFGRLSSAAEQA